jgi:hypothetical protein
MPPSASSEPPDPCPRIPASLPAAVPQGNAAEHSLFRKTSDPPEPLSRSIIAENQFGRILIEPAAKVYAAVLPRVGRDGPIQFSATLKHPWLLFNTCCKPGMNRHAWAGDGGMTGSTGSKLVLGCSAGVCHCVAALRVARELWQG